MNALSAPKVARQRRDVDQVFDEQVLARPGTRRAHEYRLSRYGVETEDVERAFGDYGRLGF